MAHSSRASFARAAALALVAAAGSVAGGGTAGAQIVGPIGPVFPIEDPTDNNFTDPALAKHSPRAVVDYRSYIQNLRLYTDDYMTLFAVGVDGLCMRRFSATTGTWNDWTHHGNSTMPSVPPQQWDHQLPVVQSNQSGAPKLRAFFAFSSAPRTNHLGRPRLDGPAYPAATYAYDQGTPPATSIIETLGPASSDGPYFNPQTAITYLEAGTQRRVHVFGNGARNGSTSSAGVRYPLIEHFHNGTSWSFTVHPMPANLGSTEAKAVVPGPQSACTVYLTPGADMRHFVFAKVDYGTQDNLMYRFWNGSSWSWVDLGSPAVGNQGVAKIQGGPVAYTYYDSANSRFKMSVFVVANRPNDVRLFEKHWVGSAAGGSWGNWQDYGNAPGVPAGVEFEMTTSAVWYDGSSSNGGNLRIHLFGYTGRKLSAMPPFGRQLLEFRWDGASWVWGGLAPLPIVEEFYTTGSAVIDRGTYDKISVFGRSSSGKIWERTFTFRNGVNSGWMWNDLSYEPLLRLAPRPSPFFP